MLHGGSGRPPRHEQFDFENNVLKDLKGGSEPLEKEINEILGSKREDRLSDPFF